MEVTARPQQTCSPAALSAKKVQFREAPHEQGASTLKASSPDGKAAAGAPGAACPELPLSHTNALFSPERQEGGWTIGAQHSGMEAPVAAAGGDPLASPSPLPSLGAASGAAYTPASSTWLESARKVSDLQGRLASLEAALKDMESKVGGGWSGGAGPGWCGHLGVLGHPTGRALPAWATTCRRWRTWTRACRKRC